MLASLFRADGADDRSVFGDFWFSPIGQNTSAGVRVGPDQAMRLSTVYRCVRVLAGTMASLPPCFYRPKGRGREKVTDIPLYRLLAKRPNRFQNSFQWHQMMMGHLALRGTGYNRIIPDGRGEIAELVPMNPDRMKVEVLDDRGRYRYRYKQPDGSEEILPAGAVFKIMGYSANGYIGLNPMEIAAESVGEGLAQQSYSTRFFANDARPTGGWIEYPGKFANDDARNVWRESYQKAQSGRGRGKVAVFENGMKYHEATSISNKDAQMLEAKNAKIADICRWFGVPPHLAFALDRATDNNIERLSLEFIKFTMRDIAECFEAAIEDQLLDPDTDLEVEYDMDKLARGEMQARGEFYQLGIQGGWLTRNEARQMEGLDPLADLDEPLVPLNMVTVGTPPEPKPGAPEPDDTPDEDAEARARALELAIAGRVVRKETVAIGKAWAKQGRTLEAFKAWATEFYSDHVEYVADSLLCTTEAGAAWCDRQLDELLAAVDRELAGRGDQVLEALEVWEKTAAVELAARVQTSAQPARPAVV